MMLKEARNFCSNGDVLHRIAQEIADHADAVGMREFNQDGDVGTMTPQDGVRRMPNAFPAENAAAGLDLDPIGIERMAAVTKPFRSELPRPTMPAALHEQPIVAQPGPIRRRQAIRFGHGNRQAGGKTTRFDSVVHSTALEPRRRLLTGVTIGPPMTMATSFRGT